jgi:pimeloyl-ACP methyl ester carboxylesterase
VIGLEKWFAGGQRVAVGNGLQLFCRVDGDGPWVTLLHGFPTCSWDWAPITDALAGEHRLLLPDLLGFGASDKPPGHRYSLVEQADLVEALWRHYEVQETGLVAHDIGASVAQELLARQAEGRLKVRLAQVVFLNAALFHGVSKPRPVQKLLANGLLGPLLVKVVSERLFSRNLAAVFSAAHPLSPDQAHAYWLAYKRASPGPHMHKLLRYIPERQQHHARWEQALERTIVPVSFVWGMQDPVSGAAVAEVIRNRLPKAELLALDDAGHYPQLEVPEQVGAALRTRL